MNNSIRVEKIQLLAAQRNMASATALLKHPGEMVLVHRGVDRAFVMCCPCGCKATLIVNLDERAGPAWRHYMRKQALTVFPSYWREDGCGSHFIIWRNRILWCSSDRYAWDEPADAEMLREVRQRLVPDRYRDSLEIADEIDALPWDVLLACRHLVREHQAIEGWDHERGHFKAVRSANGTASSFSEKP